MKPKVASVPVFVADQKPTVTPLWWMPVACVCTDPGTLSAANAA
jgi:hypothetical protein